MIVNHYFLDYIISIFYHINNQSKLPWLHHIFNQPRCKLHQPIICEIQLFSWIDHCKFFFIILSLWFFFITHTWMYIVKSNTNIIVFISVGIIELLKFKGIYLVSWQSTGSCILSSIARKTIILQIIGKKNHFWPCTFCPTMFVIMNITCKDNACFNMPLVNTWHCELIKRKKVIKVTCSFQLVRFKFTPL